MHYVFDKVSLIYQILKLQRKWYLDYLIKKKMMLVSVNRNVDTVEITETRSFSSVRSGDVWCWSTKLKRCRNITTY